MHNIGVDIGGTSIKLGIVCDEPRLLKNNSFPFPKGVSYKELVKKLAEQIHKLLHESGMTMSDIKSLGIATAGSVDEKFGKIVNAYNLGLHNAPIVSEMKNHFPEIPIFLANDADAATLAELYGGVLRDKTTAVLLTLGTGVGSGIIIDNKIFKGGLGHGNELGHMIIKQGGPLCTCGNRGCIEALCAATWLIKQGRRAIVENPSSIIYEKAEGDMDKVTAKIVIDSAREGDAIGKDIFNIYLDSLSSAIASIAVFLDPELIALGGGVSLAGSFLFEPLKELVKQKSFFKIYHEIQPAKFSNNAGIIGAAMLSESCARHV